MREESYDTNLLLTTLWIKKAITGCLDRLMGSGKLRLVNEAWTSGYAGWISDTYQVGRLLRESIVRGTSMQSYYHGKS